MGSLLREIKAPNDVKKLNEDQLLVLCEEIREQIINTVSDNGGHLASNLGVVELTVALHRVLDLPRDSIVWDVGHQSYTHKLLTGRAERFSTLRTEGGLSGFPSRVESDCDPFTTGHSSASISSALGISAANGISDRPGHVVAVIGDGALTGGLAFEGMNNAGRQRRNMIVILNDNTMSISKNVGSIARYLTHVRTKPAYLSAKDNIEKWLSHIPLAGKKLAAGVRRLKNIIKKQIFNTTIFEDLGFSYYGPFDGHDLKTLTAVLQMAKAVEKPVLIHIRTYKGRGYEYAENAPSIYHGLSAFDKEKGAQTGDIQGFSGAFGQALCAMAEKDARICAITAAMETGTGLSAFKKQFKDRFFDVGIAEEHAVTFAAGLARGGMIPVFAVYSTFLQRAYDQLIHDAALQKLKIVLAIDRAGIVGDDGQTHQGVFDASFLRSVPDIHVYSPAFYDELDVMLERCVHGEDRVYAVRYPRGKALYRPQGFVPSGRDFDVFGEPEAEICIVTYGRLFSYAAEAAEELKRDGIRCKVVKLNRIIPPDAESVRAAEACEKVFFFEEGIREGGVAEAFGSHLLQNGFSGGYFVRALDHGFVKHAPMLRILEKQGLDKDGMLRMIRENMKTGDIKNEEAN